MDKENQILKIPEVRQAVKGHTKEQLENIVTELYKILTKAQKTDNDVYSLISDPAGFDQLKGKSKDEKIRSMQDIEKETEFFITNAYAQNYFAPNRIIPKKERPKWRFLVKKIYKELQICMKKEENQSKVASLLEKLYTVMCYSCDYILFSAYDPFDSIGITQPDFFNTTLEAFDKVFEKPDFLDKGIDLIINNSLNRYTLYSELIDLFISHLNTADMKYLLIEKCKIKWEKTSSGKPDKKDDLSKYQIETNLNNLTELVFKAYQGLYEIENAIQHFKKYHRERDKEISLYVLIKLLWSTEYKDLILRELVEAEKQKIVLRQSLKELKQYIISHNQLPRYL